jgi:hypothetical protein
MADVRLSDIVDVTVYQDLDPVNSPEKTAFFESGIATRDPLLDGLAATPGKTAELPFWNDLDADTEPNYSSDDPSSDATPQKVTQGRTDRPQSVYEPRLFGNGPCPRTGNG